MKMLIASTFFIGGAVSTIFFLQLLYQLYAFN